MNLGLFGGTFDPVHTGHLVAAQELYHRLGLDRLLLIPAAVPPHKRDLAVTPGPVRVEMLRAAIADDLRFEVSDLELRRDGPSYTVDTLRALAGQHPGATLYLAMGADQLAEFGSWRAADEIRELATLVAFGRPGTPFPDGTPGDVIRIEVPALDISSTDIRRRVRERQPIRYLVPAAVAAVIEREGLYA